jgi:hypothetical protein
MVGMAPTLPTSGPIETSVYPSISYEEFGRLLRKYGYAAEALVDRNRFGYRTLAEPCFRAWMQTPFRGRPDEFASVILHGRVRLPFEVTAATLHDIDWKMMVAHVAATRRGNLVASHTLVVCGGITEHYLRGQLWYWFKDLRTIHAEVRKLTRRAAGSTLH